MIVIGLTGSIAMGKSTAARAFRRLGVPVHDADAAVRRLLGPGGAAVAAVARAFPGAVKNGAADRAELARRVFADPDALRRLEGILHPLVRRRARAFLEAAARRRAPVVVLDVPLLFETGGDRNCDWVVTVSAPAFLQTARVLRRPGMTAERLAATRTRQMPDADKRRRADIVVPTGLDRGFSFRAIGAIVALARATKQARRGRAWGPCWR